MNFKDFNASISKQFVSMINTGLFQAEIDKDKLWELYLASFPEGTNPIYKTRREYDCSCCRHFIRNAGAIVTVRESKLVSIWDIQIGGVYQIVADAVLLQPGFDNPTPDTDGGHGKVFGWNDSIVVVLQSGQRLPAVHSKNVRQVNRLPRSDYCVPVPEGLYGYC